MNKYSYICLIAIAKEYMILFCYNCMQ